MKLFVALSLLCLSLPAWAGTIEVWERGQGDYTDNNLVDVRIKKKVDLASLSTEEALFDWQYGRKATYKGVSLSIILAKAGIPGGDLVLLHFANGMIVPLEKPLTVDPFVATAMKTKKSKKFQPRFPNLVRSHNDYRDPRPIVFKGNKVVVGSGTHPYVQKLKDKDLKGDFSPWRHVDSLVGIELADRKAYEKQFIPNGEFGVKGYEVFRNRCQYCHGVRQVGAKFGWDYLDPIPIYQLKTAKHIYHRVKFPYIDGFEKGLVMPTQKDVERGEIHALWGWLKILGREKGLQSYKLTDKE